MLKTLKFKTKIEAPSSVVWTILWDPANYPKWTAPFGEGSHAVSDWKEGSSILFLGPGGGGLQSLIDKLEPNKLMRFRHIGAMKDGKPYEEESHKEWAGSIEQYELSEVDGRTILDVSVDSTETFIGFMSEKFPLALDLVKHFSEEKSLA